MERCWNEAKRLLESNARHRKGFRLQELSEETVLSQAQSELNELKLSPDDPDEMADVLGVLFHYANKKGWTMEEIEQRMLDKFSIRFDRPRIVETIG